MTAELELQIANAVIAGCAALLRQWEATKSGQLDPQKVLDAVSAIAANEAAADAAGDAANAANPIR